MNVRFLELRNLRPVLRAFNMCSGVVNMKTVRELQYSTEKYCKHSYVHVCSVCNLFLLPH